MSSPEALCAYEQERNENIARNRAFLESIGLAQPRAPPAPAAPAAPAGAAAPADAACDVDAVLAALGRAWPGRRRELAALAGALLAPGDGPVVVAGPPGGGKTSVVAAAVAGLRLPSAWVDGGALAAAGGASAPRLFDAAARSLRDRRGEPAPAAERACRDAAAFARRVDDLARDGPAWDGGRGLCVVVVDACERLLPPYRCGAAAGDEPASAAAAQLFAAARLCASTDCRVVLIGDDRRLAAAAGPRLRDPVRVDFAPYGPAAVAAAVAAAGARRGALAFGGGDRAVYGAFCAAVAAVAKRATSDVGELLVLASSRRLWEAYAAAHAAGGAAAAYGAVLPALRAALPRLRDAELDVDALVDAGGRPPPPPPPPDLPRGDALLLLAAYVCSRSPRDRDAELFAHGAARRGPRKRPRDATRLPVDGPAAVPLDRLLGVHAYLAAEHLGAEPDLRDPHLLRSLARLADLRLLERASPFDDLAHPKFTCLLDAEPAHDLADTIRLPLGRYIAQ